jgi:hypothetical protein
VARAMPRVVVSSPLWVLVGVSVGCVRVGFTKGESHCFTLALTTMSEEAANNNNRICQMQREVTNGAKRGLHSP